MFSGSVRLTVVGQVDAHEWNCFAGAGIGDGLPDAGPEQHIGLRFGYLGGGSPGFLIRASGVNITGQSDSLHIEPGRLYTATLTLTDTVTVDVSGVGSLYGTKLYQGEYNTLFVGSFANTPADPGTCSGSFERITVEPLGP
jgi:hypothetical protein